MARPLRVEYPGARYHVMCRGNQSRELFQSQEDADLFLRCLGEMCIRNQAVVHAWCLMSNHYHLLLETPQANLVDAMKWFQGTFAAEAVVLKCLTYFGMRREALCRMAKSAPEKMLMAGLLRYKFPVSASWIAQTLCMGHYTIVSKAVKFYDEAQGEWAEKKRDIIKLSD